MILFTDSSVTGTIPVTVVFTVLGAIGTAVGGLMVKAVRALWREAKPRMLSIMDEHLGLLQDTREAVGDLADAHAEIVEEHRATRQTLREHSELQQRLLAHFDRCPLRAKKEENPDGL